ncbi:protein SLX4IP [Osmerus eperlanus]|uniref:protein SLX4IP n=1 Tax=Osmerus eperlanus TaxID=29151 RepID=UPI002E1450EB
MPPHKFVIKCGNYAVLVDLYSLPLGSLLDSWITTELTEEVTDLIRGAVDQRVKLLKEIYYRRGLPKHKRELAPAETLCVQGSCFCLVGDFVKRHSRLRCVVKERYGELRVFPERYVVCASRPEEAKTFRGNPSQSATEPIEQSRSEYFSRPGETQALLNSSTITKRTALQKIARQASARPKPCGSTQGKQRPAPGEQREERPGPGEQREEKPGPGGQREERPGPGDQRVERPGPGEQRPGPGEPRVERPGPGGHRPRQVKLMTTVTVHQSVVAPCLTQPSAELRGVEERHLAEVEQPRDTLTDQGEAWEAGQKQRQHGGEPVSPHSKPSRSKRGKPSPPGDAPRLQRAKRACPEAPPDPST